MWFAALSSTGRDARREALTASPSASGGSSAPSSDAPWTSPRTPGRSSSAATSSWCRTCSKAHLPGSSKRGAKTLSAGKRSPGGAEFARFCPNWSNLVASGNMFEIGPNFVHIASNLNLAPVRPTLIACFYRIWLRYRPSFAKLRPHLAEFGPRSVLFGQIWCALGRFRPVGRIIRTRLRRSPICSRFWRFASQNWPADARKSNDRMTPRPQLLATPSAPTQGWQCDQS